MGTHHGDSLIKPLFVFIHFFVFHYSLNVFPSCFFPYLVNNTHIFDLAHVVPFAFVHFLPPSWLLWGW
jgi:hypothetical protein